MTVFIETTPTGKFFKYFDYSKKEKSNSYYLFENPYNDKIIVFKSDKTENTSFLLLSDFKQLTKKELFLHLIKSKPLNNTMDFEMMTQEITELQDWEEIHIKKKKNPHFFISHIFSLTPHEKLFEKLNHNFFKREHIPSVVLYRNGKPIDILCGRNPISSYTVFSNPMGFFHLKHNNIETLIVQNPFYIQNEYETIKNYDLFFCSTNPSETILHTIKNFEKIFFFNRSIQDKLFILKFLIFLYNQSNEQKINLYYNQTHFYIEVSFEKKTSKIDILKYNSEIHSFILNGLCEEFKHDLGQNHFTFDISKEKINTISFNINIFNLDKLIKFYNNKTINNIYYF